MQPIEGSEDKKDLDVALVKPIPGSDSTFIASACGKE